MNRKWWLEIKEKYPQALDECLQHFQRIHKDNWREEIKDPNWLDHYFKFKKIEIHTRNISSNEGTKYGSKIWGEDLQLWRSMVLNSEQEAQLDAFYLAFWMREETLKKGKSIQGTTRKKIP